MRLVFQNAESNGIFKETTKSTSQLSGTQAKLFKTFSGRWHNILFFIKSIILCDDLNDSIESIVRINDSKVLILDCE